MAGRGFTCFSDAILQIDCISCIRCILNTGIGLEYFVSNDVYTKKLTMGNVLNFIYEPRCEKTGLRGFRPGGTQTRLYNHTRLLEA